jgi:protein TonB
MTYASANRRPNPAALLGALGIPGAFGALLVVGLAVTAVTQPAGPRIKGVEVDDFILPPPPPTDDNPVVVNNPTAPTTSIPTTPSQPTTLPIDLGLGDPVDAFPGTGDLGTGTVPVDFGQPVTGPSASPFDPVGARPKGNPGKWVTNDDYRSRWIMEQLSGTARFSLAIDASGKVTGCTVTRSTGHAALDAATCNLLTKRARFEAARDGSGKAVEGSYNGSVTWKIPE